jgi:cytochrome c nitrite reductase small subunit
MQFLSGKWRIPALISIGVVIGLCGVVIRASNATSYLSNDAEVCINCHVMNDAYSAWKHGSHGRVAVCNDCHVPHLNPVGKFAFKAMDGARHSAIFTLRKEPEVLRLNSAAVTVVESNCIRCHANQFYMVRLAESSERPCWSCHSIHGQVRSLSASPFSMHPSLPKAGILGDSELGQKP